MTTRPPRWLLALGAVLGLVVALCAALGLFAMGYVVRDWELPPKVERYYVDDREIPVAVERRNVVSVRYIDSYEQARVLQFDTREDAEAFIAGYLGGRR